MTLHPSRYSVLGQSAEVQVELERKRSRFLTILRRVESPDEAQHLVDALRKEHHTARHHCSAWIIGPDRRVQRAHDDGEPSGTAGAPMLEALSRAQMPGGEEDLSDVAAVVVRWFGGTLLGAGGLVSAYSDSVVQAVNQARTSGLFMRRQRMRQFRLAAPIAQAGRWENELRVGGITVLGTDYASRSGHAVLALAVSDDQGAIEDLRTRIAALSAGSAQVEEAGVDWVDAEA